MCNMDVNYVYQVYSHREVTPYIEDFLKTNPYMLNRLESESLGYKQDKMMATLYLAQTRNEYIRKSYIGLRYIDWSYDTVFEKPGLYEQVKTNINVRLNRGKVADEFANRLLSHEFTNDNNEYDGV